MKFVQHALQKSEMSKGLSSTFTGDVYLQKLYEDEQNLFANVLFLPGTRTNWHTHEAGQLIQCTAGSGWICDRGGTPRRIKEGDTIWCPPGTEHWHGGDEQQFMVHFVHTHGQTTWLEVVTHAEYEGSKSS